MLAEPRYFPLLKFLRSHEGGVILVFTKFIRTSTDKFPCDYQFQSCAHASKASHNKSYKNISITGGDNTYVDQDTVEVQRFAPTLFPTSSSTQYLCQASGAVDFQDVDVILAAKSLNESEVNLQGHVFNVLLICSQDAQNYIIRVSVGREGYMLLACIWFKYTLQGLLPHRANLLHASGQLMHLHIERLGSLVDSHCNAALWQRRGEDFL